MKNFFLCILTFLSFSGLSQTNEQIIKGRVIVISPQGDTLPSEIGRELNNSGIFNSSIEVNEGVITVKLDSTNLTKMIGNEFPFDLKAIAKSKEISFNSGYPTILNIWSITCRPCVEEIPTLNGVVKQYPNFNYIAITNSNDSLIDSFLNKYPFYYSIITGQNDIIQYFKDAGLPTHIFIDKNMVIDKIICRKINDEENLVVKWINKVSSE